MSNKTNILLVEDDPNLGSLLQEYIIAKGYNCQLETDGDKGLKAFFKGFLRLMCFRCNDANQRWIYARKRDKKH